jgi:hypothetical protein
MAERKRARELASNFIERGDPLGWFDPLYREARKTGSSCRGRIWLPIPICFL